MDGDGRKREYWIIQQTRDGVPHGEPRLHRRELAEGLMASAGRKPYRKLGEIEAACGAAFDKAEAEGQVRLEAEQRKARATNAYQRIRNRPHPGGQKEAEREAQAAAKAIRGE